MLQRQWLMDQLVKRSEDGGASWGVTIIVRQGEPPCDGCPAAISNPTPVEVALANGETAVVGCRPPDHRGPREAAADADEER